LLKVPYFDLHRQYESIRDEIEPAVLSILESGVYVLGENVERFEQEFSEFCGASHAVGVNSGTTALQMALLAYGIGPGDEVIVPAMTFIATAAAVEATGATPVLADIEHGRWTLSPEDVEKKITPRTKAIIPVHLYGRMADVSSIKKIANRIDAVLIEDAAQAHGAMYDGTMAGSHGDAACFSFYPAKNLGAAGEAGAVVTSDSKIALKIKQLRDWGQSSKYNHDFRGFNGRMDNIQGAVLRIKLRRLAAWTQKRIDIAKAYSIGLADANLSISDVSHDGSNVFHVYPVLHHDRNALATKLNEAGISTGIHYPQPVHLTAAYADLGGRIGDHPVSENLADNELSLPMFPEMNNEEVEAVISAVRDNA
jgi:dTDP-4-amino-4,6-dideoxygalactose transaminase